MKVAYIKDSVRKLKSSIFQYISIILIIALGVAFFMGMNVVSPSMELTSEKYLKEQKIYDIQLVSTVGWTDEDVTTVRKDESVDIAEGAYIKDVLVELDDRNLAVRLNSMPTIEMNEISLTDGRKPENKNECVIDTRMNNMYGFNIGDTIKIKSGTDEDIDDIVNVKKFTVVGVTKNPVYLSQYYGITQLETGELNGFMMLDKDAFESDYYSAIYLRTVEGKELNHFSDEYKEKMDELGPKILKNLVSHSQDRCDELYEDALDEYEEKKKELKDSIQEFKDAEKLIEDAEEQVNELEDVWKNVKQQYLISNILSPGSTNISIEYIETMLDAVKEQKEEVDKQKKEFENKKIEYNQEIEDATQKLDDAEYQLDNFTVDLYQNNLTKNDSFVSLKNDLVKIGMMGKVFPLMFFVVAALVTITTVSRTIEDERNNIGILKALGYSNKTIALKFVIYSFITAIVGTVLGMALGYTIILQILFDSYSSLYALPDLIKDINWKYILLVIGLSSISIIGVTIFVVSMSLREKASELLRPKSVKEGKNIALEKVGFMWKHFNFFYKSSFRNIFRYKRRLIMALLGIAGCTALIYTGFALKNSIDSIAVRQFSQVKEYDMEINLKNDLTTKKIQNVLDLVKENDDITEYTPVRQQSTSLWFNDQRKDLYYVVIDKKDVNNFINLKERETSKDLKLNNKGIIITEKLAKTFGINVNDKVKIGDDVKSKEVKVIGISENYLYNFIYMTPKLYEEVYDEEIKYNQIFANVDNLNEDEAKEVVDELKEDIDKIAGVLLTSNVDKEYQKSLNSLASIVFLFIGCASLLAFIVLVNLNIINISERKRELATLKLLGFYNNEVSSYVFRENVILTIIGIALGLLLGNGVLGLIIQSAEVETIMLPNELNLQSFGYAAILTLIFTLVTNLVMSPKLRKIDMIDSLKSVE